MRKRPSIWPPGNLTALIQTWRAPSGTHLSPFITPLSSAPPHIHNHFMKRCGSALGGGTALCLERDQEKIQGRCPHFTDEETPPFNRLEKGSYDDMRWRGLSLTNRRRRKRENHMWEERIWKQSPASRVQLTGALWA